MKSLISFLLWLCLHAVALAGQQESQESCASRNCVQIFYESFETGMGDWGSVAAWEICDPSECPPPDSARSGDSCVATVCCGNVATGTRLVGPHLHLPLIDTGEVILFRFWHCYWKDCILGGSQLHVQLSVDDSAWFTIYGPFCGEAPKWTVIDPVDLTKYAGHKIKLGFWFDHVFGSFRGWYIDDVLIELCSFGCSAGADKSLCRGESIQFLDAKVEYGLPIYAYSWSPCAGLSDCDILNPIASPETTTTYVLHAQDAVGNECFDTVVVTVLPAPDCSDLSDTTIRLGESIVLDASGMATSYHWSTGETTPTIGVTPVACGDSLVWVQMEGCSQVVTCSLTVLVQDTTRPTNVSATDDRCNVVITWEDNSDCEDGFWIYRGGQRIGQVGPNVTTYPDNPGPGTYSYCVRSHQGSDSSAAVCDMGTAKGTPDPPSGFTASDGLCGRVEIKWRSVPSATSYNVYRNGGLIGPTSDTAFEDRSASEGITYSYCVTAVNDCGESTCSVTDSGWAAPSDLSVKLTVLSVNRHDRYASLSACPIGGTAPYDYRWFFGDADYVIPQESGSGIDSCHEVGHTYSEVGLYRAIAEVTDAAGCQAVDSIEVEIPTVPTDVIEVDVYPNPANSDCHIKYTLFEQAEVSVELFTLRGREIRSFTHRDATDGQGGSEGEHTINWDLTNESGFDVANGVYICRVTAEGRESGETVEIKKKVSVVK
jgi:hypothetical protein